MKRLTRTKLFFAACLLVAWFMMAFVLRKLERALVFPAYATRADRHPRLAPNIERWWLDIEDGQVEAWFMQASGDAPRPAVIFAHGNAELIDDWSSVFSAYEAMDFHVLMPEFRGYGRSDGTPSQEAILADFRSFYDRLTARPDVDSSRIFLHGRSLGGGVVIALAAQRKAAALVVQSTFTSIADLAKKYFVPRGLLENPFDSEAILKNLRIPVLIAHGTHDRVTPPDHARRLAEAAPGAKLLWYNAGHNDCPPQWPPFWQEVRSFLSAPEAATHDSTERI